jgi:hypothetical protein
MTEPSEQKGPTWTEELEINAGELVDRVKELIEEGNVRRLIIRKPNDEILLEVPLTAGVAVGGAVTLFAPVLAALGALAALLAKVKIQIVRTNGEPGE